VGLENVTLRDEDVMEGTIIDITDRKHAQEQVEYRRTTIRSRACRTAAVPRPHQHRAAHAKRTGRLSAVMFPDLDQFKLVNDTRPHGRRPSAAGDRRASRELRARGGHGCAHGRR
jgi:predicted signal transduction protein with EAL and GGDEF domain